MAHRFLVPLDGSAVSEAVLEWVTRTGKELGAAVTLLQVVVPLPAGSLAAMAPMALPDDTLERTLEELKVQAREYLAQVAGRLAQEGLRCDTAVRVGVPADEILAACEAAGADLVAMATHGRSGIGRLVLGSVAEEVVRRSRTPVLLVRPQKA
jgi:nucleotide-binding universal stress UspA family protein